MQHFIQYHNTDKRGSRPIVGAGGEFCIISSKNMDELVGQQVWLISGEGPGKKTFYLEYTFTVTRVERGTPNEAYGSNGILFDPPVLLSGMTWFDEFKANQQNFSLGLRKIDERSAKEFERLREQYASTEDAALRQVSRLSVNDYFNALIEIQTTLTENQKNMLLAHVNSRDHSISMGMLAHLVGYPDYEAANLQYGKVGSLLATELGISGLSQKTQILAVASKEADPAGHWHWIMRPALVEALKKLWPVSLYQTPEELAAAAEIDKDPLCQNLKPTERYALVQARIGQGEYRKNLMKLWGDRCAVTSCDLDTVLVASHAKPWRDCTNEERLNPFNGLLLAASVDRLFDKGLISFSDNGQILVCDQLTDQQLHSVGLSRNSRLAQIHKDHLTYLDAHRRNIFKGSRSR